MSKSYEDLIDYAYILVNIVNEKYESGNEIAYFPLLSGIGPFKVGNEHNYQAVVDAINRYYSDNQNENTISAFECALYTMLKGASNLSTLELTIDIIFYQFKLEDENKSSFKLDRKQIVDKINNKIKVEYSDFKSNNTLFEEWLDRNRKYAMTKFGVTLI